MQRLRICCGILAVAVCATAGILLHYLPRDASHFAKPAAIVSAQPIEAEPTSSQIKTAVGEPLPTPDTSATDEELLTLARGIVSGSPQRAIDWARAQSDPTLGRRCLFAAIRAWGERDPNAAVDWALAQPDDEHQTDVEAALAGAVQQPQQAIAIVRGLLKYYDPADHASAAPALVVALNNAGQFQAALDFIQNSPPDLQSDWMRATFERWGASQPQQAIEALNSIIDDKLRDDAFQALIRAWSTQEPSAVAEYATSLPDGDDRAFALTQLVENWSLQDPAAFATWLNTSPSGLNLDGAIATLISKSDGANGSPEVTVRWAERISDSDLRYDSIKHVLDEWNQTDPAAVQTYVATTPSLDDKQRHSLLKSLQTPIVSASN
jgi:hypothetical protein